MEIIKKKFDSTEVDTYQVIDDDKVIFEGSIEECHDFVFANI